MHVSTVSVFERLEIVLSSRSSSKTFKEGLREFKLNIASYKEKALKFPRDLIASSVLCLRECSYYRLSREASEPRIAGSVCHLLHVW